MSVEIDSEADDLNDVATKVKEEFNLGGVAVIGTEDGRVRKGMDREGWMFSDVIGAIEMAKHNFISGH